MKKIIFITGKQGSGKSTKAESIVKNRKVEYAYTSLNKDDMMHLCLHQVDVVVFDELINLSEKNINNLICFMQTNEIKIRPPYHKDGKLVKLPDLIFICQGNNIPIKLRNELKSNNIKYSKISM